ncbi:MAG: hydroxypyruvate isomerase family protein [Planctomycetota bacterium JB042]
MNRRDALRAGGAAAAAAFLAPRAAAQDDDGASANPPFSMKYAPHLGMFRHLAGDDPLDQIRFMHDVGFRAFEDNGMRNRPVELQKRIGDLLEKLGMTMGVFVGHSQLFGTNGFATGDGETRERFVNDMKDAVEIAKRVRATWMTVVPGERTPRLELDYQTAHLVETLKRGAAVLEPAGLVMVLEPLNPWVNHPNMLLAKVPHAYLVCKAVASPACKILFDMYHQQITEGNILGNVDHAWDEIAYFQIGDHPGRNEPTTGEMNYRNIFRRLADKGYDGVLGMEHGNSRGGAEGEQAVIEAYRVSDG